MVEIRRNRLKRSGAEKYRPCTSRKRTVFLALVYSSFLLFFIFDISRLSNVWQVSSGQESSHNAVHQRHLFSNSNHLKNICKSMNHQVVQIIAKQTRSITFLDVGGHEGKTTFPPLLCLPITHRVITVEPVPFNQNTLSERGARNGLVEPSYHWKLIRGAFSNRTEKSTIYVPGKYTDNASLMSSAALFNVAGSRKYKGTAIPQNVQLYKGDDLLFENSVYPDFIKIDVQGAEALVISGLSKILSMNRDMLVFAEHDPGLALQYHLRLSDAFQQMVQMGFKAYCHAEIGVENGRFFVSENSTTVTEEQVSSIKYLWKNKCQDIIYWKLGI